VYPLNRYNCINNGSNISNTVFKAILNQWESGGLPRVERIDCLTLQSQGSREDRVNHKARGGEAVGQAKPGQVNTSYA
jgi:hypothetical protein